MTLQQPNRIFSITSAWSKEDGWDLLYYYNLYRLGLAIFLSMLAYPMVLEGNINVLTRPLIIPIAGIVIVSVVTFANIIRRSPNQHVQSHLSFLLDILFFGMLAFGGYLAESSSVALYVTVAATAVVFRIRIALIYAAICAYIELYTEYLDYLAGSSQANSFYFSMVTAIGLFAIAFVVGYVANKTSKAQLIAEQQKLALTDLDQINHLVVNQLEMGIVILDKILDVKLINQSATNLISSVISRHRIEGKLAHHIIRIVNKELPADFSINIGKNILGISTVPLRNGLLMQIEDRTRLSRRIQKTKLATIGRMASAIAHEIRNPLNAINHAAQLLQPVQNPGSESQRLLDKIRTQAQKIDGIVESVLQRSRTGQARQRIIDLDSWLKNFVDSFRQLPSKKEVRIHHGGKQFDIYFDPIQLEQIITNLCQNNISHSQTIGPIVEITLHTDIDDLGNPYLEVLDYGKSVDVDNPDKLFEPFQSTDSSKGSNDDSADTGLGLFLVREFCSINGADVQYIRDIEKHGFRISFLLQHGVNG